MQQPRINRRSFAIAAAAAVAGLALSSPALIAADAAPAAVPAAGGPAGRARTLADKGLAFLKAAQQPDGLWQTSPRDPPGISALVLRAFAQDPATGYKADFVRRGYDKLVALQKPDGGIYVDMLSNYNTAIAVSALAAAGSPDLRDEIDKAVGFLKGVQITGDAADPSRGGASYGGPARGGRPPRADLSNTHMMIDALRDAGLKPDDPAFREALAFVTRAQNLSETNDQKWAGDDGGFVYTPADGGNSNAGEYTGPDGKRMLRSYGLMTYAGLKSMIYAGLTKDDKRVTAAWDWITKNWTLDEHPGMRAAGPDKAKAGMYFYYHTLAAALHAYGEPVVTDPKGQAHDWRAELVDKLASLQRPDGSWVGDKSWMENNPVLTTAYVVLALQQVQKDLEQRPAK